MEILEAFDVTGTLRGAAELAGCDHKTVAHWVRAREEAGGGLAVSVGPRSRVDAFAEKIEEWVDRSRGKIHADVAHQRLVAMGYLGSDRTTRRAVAEAKRLSMLLSSRDHGRPAAGRAIAIALAGGARRPAAGIAACHAEDRERDHPRHLVASTGPAPKQSGRRSARSPRRARGALERSTVSLRRLGPRGMR